MNQIARRKKSRLTLTSSSKVLQAFQATYRDFLEQLDNAEHEPRHQLREAYRDYRKKIQSIDEKCRKNIADHHCQLVRNLEESAGEDDRRQLGYTAYDTYLDAVSREVDEADEHDRSADREYREAVEQAGQEASTRINQAYADYVTGLQKIWTNADSQSVDLRVMVRVSDSMRAAAYRTDYTLATWESYIQTILQRSGV